LKQQISDITFSVKQSPRQSQKVDPPSDGELSTFFEMLDSSKEKPAILKITPPYSKQYIPNFVISPFYHHYQDFMIPMPLEWIT